MNNLPQNNNTNSSTDFIVGDDGHAGLSLRKTAELLKVSRPAISHILRGGIVVDQEEAELVVLQGIRGGIIVKLAGHFSQAHRVRADIRQHCTELLEKAAKIGIQVFIDRMAGIADVTQSQQPLLFVKPTPEERLNVIERSISLLDRLNGLDDRTRLAFCDCIRNITLEGQLARTSSTTERSEWPISDRVVALGYKTQNLETLKSIGIIAGRLYKQKHGCKPPKREQYVEGTTRYVNCYGSADLDIVDQAIRAKLGEPPSNNKNLPLAQ